MSSSGSSSYDEDSRRSDGLLPSSEETQPVEQVDVIQEASSSQRGHSRTSSPSPPHTPIPGPHTRLLLNSSDLGESTSNSSISHPLAPGFVSSPLNPNHLAPPRPRKPTRTSTLGTVQRVASEEALALSADSRRGSMILYRLADDSALPAPRPLRELRGSTASSSRESVISISYDSKYPSGAVTQAHRGFIPYVYNPEIDSKRPPEPDDYLYEPTFGENEPWYQAIGWRGVVNLSMLVILLIALLALFICYPVVSSQHYDTLKLIAKDIHINSTGQYAPFSQTDTNEQRYALPFLKDPEFQS